MIQYSQALRTILLHPLSLGSEPCRLLDSIGRVLARAFAAPESLPRHTYSAMDGFATSRTSLRGATSDSPVILRVAGESRPGKPYAGPALRRGEPVAVAIATGGALPTGADAIVPVEWTVEAGKHQVSVTRIPGKGDYIRRAGGDVKAGKTLLPAGRAIDAAAQSVIAQFNVDTIEVARRPRVAILTSGDELIPLGGAPDEGDRIVATNLYYVSRKLTEFGTEVRNFGIAGDRLDAVHRRLARALEWGDLVVTVAGVSAGKRDFVVEALERLDGEVLFHGVAIKPGKPALFALAGGKPVMALPGNPLSAACGLEIFLKPYIRASMGAVPALPPRMEVPLARAAARDRRRLSFLFSRLSWTSSGPAVVPPRRESGNLTLLADADCLVEVPPGDADIAAGALVRVWPLR